MGYWCIIPVIEGLPIPRLVSSALPYMSGSYPYSYCATILFVLYGLKYLESGSSCPTAHRSLDISHGHTK